MSQVLTVRDGATGTVSTGGMLQAAGLLRVFAARAEAGRDRLAGALSPESGLSAVFGGGTAAVVDTGLDDLRSRLATAAAAAQSLAAGLLTAATAYAEAEDAARRRAESIGGPTAYVLGVEFLAVAMTTPFGPFLPLLSSVPSGDGRPLPASVGTPRSPTRARPAEPYREPGLFGTWARRGIGSEHFVDFTRAAVSSTDELAAGVTAIPLNTSDALEARGRRGVEVSARRLGDVLPGDLLRETGVTVHRIPSSAAAAAAPRTFAQVAERIPAARAGEPQVRIERFAGSGGRPQWVVYVGGTIETSVLPKADPWDMTSNIAAVGNGDAGSVRAVVTAMKAEGIGSHDPVTIAGHSQGGIVATRVAQRADVNVKTLITYGSPVGQMPLPSHVRAVSFEHDEDIIPTLGGEPQPVSAAGQQGRVVVTRDVYDGTVPTDITLPAHKMARYAETSALADASGEPALDAVKTNLRTLSGTGGAIRWQADRDG
jgi:pimeloyl-ACP methyl ester carboxylesterase